jgi:hypothetical protein
MGRFMLVQMHRPSVLHHGALVVTLALAVLACTGAAPTPAPATVRPDPTPVKSADLGAQYIRGLVAAFATDPLVMHVVVTENLIVREGKDSSSLDQSLTLDLSGRDMSAHLTTTKKGKTTTLDLVVVGMSGYLRAGSDPFRKSTRADHTEDFMNIVQSLRLVRHPSYLEYVGAETIDRIKLQHLTAIRDVPYITNTGDAATLKKLDIWVDESGTPFIAKTKSSMIGAYGREIDGTTEFRFTNFDGPITIVAPKD